MPPDDGSNRPIVSSNLSFGAKAGIGAGVSIGVTVISVLSFLLYRSSRYRRLMQHAVIQNMLQIQPSRGYEKPEMTGVPARTEMDGESAKGRPMQELCGGGLVPELYQTGHLI